MYQYHSHPIYDISYSIHVTFYPLYLWHHIHYVLQHNTVCGWYHTRHMCDIICTTDDLTSTLSHQNTVLWCPIHFRHDITPTVSDTTPSVSLSSQPNFVITYPLFYDIIPTLCVTSYAFHITSYQLLMSSHYCTYNISASIYETSSCM